MVKGRFTPPGEMTRDAIYLFCLFVFFYYAACAAPYYYITFFNLPRPATATAAATA